MDPKLSTNPFKRIAFFCLCCFIFSNAAAQKISRAGLINKTTAEIVFEDKQRLTIDFYGENIFRLFQDNNGGIIRPPEAKPEASILVENPRKPVSRLTLKDENGQITISTAQIKVLMDKNSALIKVVNLQNQAQVLEETTPVQFDKNRVTLTLKENPEEYFYGGGVQNGRFSHKGKSIAIENQNSWTDGGVASPTPFYWSTNGYGILWHSFKRGRYDFGAREKGLVKLSHETNYLDLFIMVNNGAAALLNDFYQLTGNPVLLPKFGFYEGHLNAYNRDFWKEDANGILFEDGKRYKESQKDNGGIKESLNGEKNNYQFSARAVIDRYKKHDMPLGWLLPNDGYGAGYGQTESLDGNIQNLKNFGDYARKNGVEIGLWTQSDLHPKAEVSALLQRDILKEVRDAGVRVLKTDVAWVGAGYSFGLNGVADVGQTIPYYGNDARPFIISLDGWAGTQRYASVWSGDQTGGQWEYIRFHIPTYIGSGLSGQPNITSDMDGIFGGKNAAVNIRDFQWKTFSPMQLNMDGWGSNEKYPHALGEPATSINRMYLKLKSQLLPYSYSIAKEAVTGLPMIRAMFLAYPNAYTYGTSTQYQFLYGPDFLVAPIYKATNADEKGNDIRNGIYLPEGTWIDYFSGEKYEGNRIINSFSAPVWKLPVFVKSGAIVPMTKPNNNVSQIDNGVRCYEFYPSGQSSFTAYDDDGVTESYKLGNGATTKITSALGQKNNLSIVIYTSLGSFEGMLKEKTTLLQVNVSQKPKNALAKIGGKKIKLTEVNSIEEFKKQDNVYFYDAKPNLNKFATSGSDFEKTVITKNPQLLVQLEKTDITQQTIEVEINGVVFDIPSQQGIKTGALALPGQAQISDKNTAAFTLKPSWKVVPNADFYEIDFKNMLYTTIRDTAFLLDGLTAETDYELKLRAVNKDGHSDWTTLKAHTKANPLQFALKGIRATTTAENQGGYGIGKLVDFDEDNTWHTKWGKNALPFEVILDLRGNNQLDKINYLPRTGGGNGVWLKGTIYYSSNKENWTNAGSFEWARNGETKVFDFANHPTARYIKIAVTDGVGGFGSGRELYVFKVPGTESYLPGDINNDQKIDENDLVSYTNYTGLRKGDGDFEGYISKGDLNNNDLIDAYDISTVATQLDGGVNDEKIAPLAGKISISAAKTAYNKDETIELTVKGTDLSSVNAFSFALPYNQQDYEFVGIEPLAVKEMDNLSNDRLHTNGKKALYPTFVNVGDKDALNGNQDLFILKLKAKRKVTFNLKPIDGLLVDKNLNSIKF
ncbi:TIM-barrel domain-containing protein [Pedobacter nutrimenti]|uniref:Alpha-glucosidase (Family GH31 glycosyl hydrolase) n=1 Tax=Pedobacter nutrimenti TaxID=1241337 RepID=A0A318ULZ4_9SPHI|nr:TIM-barrel domain-containing protein [Pedobacter nutrimenti]PYF76540.1 alpha-glucosidase (family GH31 glycosyl hydrolase) [Pedobacter nutrimenti]